MNGETPAQSREQVVRDFCEEIVRCMVVYGGWDEQRAHRTLDQSGLCAPEVLAFEDSLVRLLYQYPYFHALSLVYGTEDPQWYNDEELGLWPPPEEATQFWLTHDYPEPPPANDHMLRNLPGGHADSTVPLPSELRRIIDSAYMAVLNHRQHALLPGVRRRLYTTITTFAANNGYQARAWLDLITARRVLHIWKQARPDDSWVEGLLHTAEGVLLGKIPGEQASLEADDAWRRWESLPEDEPEYERLSVEAFHALSAAVEALFVASRRFRFNSTIITPEDTDADLDSWSRDTASWAVSAYAGPTWEQDSDPVKRKEFWEWWLKEAIPTAWGLAMK